MVIKYEDVAIKWCKIQEDEMEENKFDSKLNDKIEKIFQWDRKLNLIC